MNSQMRRVMVNRRTIITAAALVIIAAAVITGAIMFGLGRKRDVLGHGKDIAGSNEGVLSGTYLSTGELIGTFLSREEAIAAAGQYGITLKSYESRIAVFTVDDGRDAAGIIELGKKNGWPRLELNYERSLY